MKFYKIFYKMKSNYKLRNLCLENNINYELNRNNFISELYTYITNKDLSKSLYIDEEGKKLFLEKYCNVLFLLNENIDYKNNLIKFNNENIIFVTDKNDDIWFKAVKIATVLGYIKPENAILKNVMSEDKKYYADFINNISPPLRGGEMNQSKLYPQTIFINESGLYSLILSSKLEKAKPFKRFITKDILPTLRKYGEFKLKKELNSKESEITKLSKSINELNLKISESEKNHNKRHDEMINEIKSLKSMLNNRIVKPNNNQLDTYVIIYQNLINTDEYFIHRTQKKLLNNIKTQYKDRNKFRLFYENYDPNAISFINKLKELPIIENNKFKYFKLNSNSNIFKNMLEILDYSRKLNFD